MVTVTGTDLQINNAYKCGGNRIPPKKSNIVTLSKKNVLILVFNFSSFCFTSRSNKKWNTALVCVKANVD